MCMNEPDIIQQINAAEPSLRLYFVYYGFVGVTNVINVVTSSTVDTGLVYINDWDVITPWPYPFIMFGLSVTPRRIFLTEEEAREHLVLSKLGR